MTTPVTTVPATGIHLQQVSKAFGSTEVLTDVSAYLPPDRIYGLLGANGVGKTTLMSVICNHTFRSGGTVLIDGADPAENAEVLARTCFIREDQPYNDAFKVRDVLEAVPWFYPNWDAALAERLVDRFRLPHRTTCKKLSRGQRSALAIVISLAARAPYTFLDEPYLGLDASARTIFYDELLLAYAEHPRTIVMSTHLIDEAAGLMEEVLVLDGGRIVLRADADEARASAFIARGLDTAVTAFVGDREVLSERRLGRILSLTVRGTLTGHEQERARASNIALEGASLQDLVAALGSGLKTEHDTTTEGIRR